MLEEKRATTTALLFGYDHERGTETQDNKITLEFLRVPDLTVLLFEMFSATRLGVDLSRHGPANVFSWIDHAFLLRSDGYCSYDFLAGASLG